MIKYVTGNIASVNSALSIHPYDICRVYHTFTTSVNSGGRITISVSAFCNGDTSLTSFSCLFPMTGELCDFNDAIPVLLVSELSSVILSVAFKLSDLSACMHL